MCAKVLVLAVGVAALCLLSACNAQLSYHNDANTNSFSLKAPGVQTSFTRYFGGQRGNLLQGAAAATPEAPAQQQLAAPPAQPFAQQPFFQPQPQPQPQSPYFQPPLPQPQPQSQEQPQTNFWGQQQPESYPYSLAASSPYQTQVASPYASPAHYQTQQYPQLHRQQVQQQFGQPQPLQPQSKTLENLHAAYLAYQHQQQQQLYAQQQYQQQQYQQQLLRQLYQNTPTTTRPPSTAQSQQGYTADSLASFLTNQQAHILRDQQKSIDHEFSHSRFSTPSAPTSTFAPYTTAATPTTERLLGVQYSPSDKVSHVKFASGNLAYNF